MRIQTEDERQVATATLKEVMSKLEEALRLSRELEEHERQVREHCCGVGTHG
jgi:DNA-directed RNA polymerase subunit L